MLTPTLCRMLFSPLLGRLAITSQHAEAFPIEPDVTTQHVMSGPCMAARAKGRLFTVLTSKQPVVMPSWHWHDVISTDDANLVSFRKSPRLELAILDRFLQHKLHVLPQRQHAVQAASFRPLHLAPCN